MVLYQTLVLCFNGVETESCNRGVMVLYQNVVTVFYWCLN